MRQKQAHWPTAASEACPSCGAARGEHCRAHGENGSWHEVYNVHESRVAAQSERIRKADERAAGSDARYVAFSLSGAAVQVVREGNFPSDEPAIWQAISEAPRRKRGAGVEYQLTMTRTQAKHLADYILSVVEVERSMSAEERGGSRVYQAGEKALRRIEEALGGTALMRRFDGTAP